MASEGPHTQCVIQKRKGLVSSHTALREPSAATVVLQDLNLERLGTSWIPTFRYNYQSAPVKVHILAPYSTLGEESRGEKRKYCSWMVVILAGQWSLYLDHCRCAVVIVVGQ